MDDSSQNNTTDEVVDNFVEGGSSPPVGGEAFRAPSITERPGGNNGELKPPLPPMPRNEESRAAAHRIEQTRRSLSEAILSQNKPNTSEGAVQVVHPQAVESQPKPLEQVIAEKIIATAGKVIGTVVRVGVRATKGFVERFS